MKKFQYKQSDRVVINPCKGWLLTTPDAATLEGSPIVPYGSVGYCTFFWKNIEPEEGVYNWQILDTFIDSFAKIGKRVCFGIEFFASGGHEGVPEFVYEAGAGWQMLDFYNNISRKSTAMRIPEHDDPILLEKYTDFLDALAARYDGNPNIEFIDMRSLGNWGEGHSILWKDPSHRKEYVDKHLQLHIDRFKKTKLVTMWGEEQYEDIYVKHILEDGVGMRRDGIMGNSDGMQPLPAMGRGPGVFEFWGSYKILKDYGWWYGKKKTDAFADNGTNIAYFFPKECCGWWDKGNSVLLENCGGITLEQSVLHGRPTHIRMEWGRSGAEDLLRENPELIKRLANRMGYNFMLEAAQYTETATDHIDFTFLWHNTGISMLYRSAHPVAALTNSAGKIVRWFVCDNELSRVYPSYFTESEASLPVRDLPGGTYTLWAGLFPDEYPTPEIGAELPESWISTTNEEVEDNRWMKIGPVQIS